MPRQYFFNHVVHLLAPRQWLVVAVFSGLLAFGSGLYLAVLAGMPLGGPVAQLFDRTELFIRDTIRLTFKNRSEKRIMTGEPAVFMAPLGILEPDRTFKWLDAPELSMVSAGSASAEVPVAVVPVPVAVSTQPLHVPVKVPSRVLDPDWKPDFKGD